MNVVLYQPEIPPNTGSVGRLCAAAEIPLHLIGPLGFKLDDRHLKRAGLDYWPHVDLHVYGSWEEFLSLHRNARILYFSKKASKVYTDARFSIGDFLVFGPETRGLPQYVLDTNCSDAYRIPMKSPHVRSLNLANAVSIVLYESLRQTGAFEAHPSACNPHAVRPGIDVWQEDD